jgi:RES domain-containing protein
MSDGTRITAYRAAEPAHDDLGETLEMSRATPGRFNTPAFGAVYASLDPDTALRERLLGANATGEIETCGLFLLELTLQRVVDLNDNNERERWTLSQADVARDDLTACQKAAPRIIAAGYEAVRWPSASGAGDSIAIYLDRLAAGSSCRVVRRVTISQEQMARVRGGTAAEEVVGELTGGRRQLAVDYTANRTRELG